MATHDLGHKLTDKELTALEKRIAGVYKDARDGLNDTISEYFAKFVERDKHQQELLKAGKITEEQYKQWRLNQIGRGKRYEALRDEIAKRYTDANQVAVSYVNDATPGIYSLNRNYAAYTIEKEVGNVGFNLFDEQTVKRLIVEEPNLMPYYPKKRAVARGIDLAWGKQQITASVTSGILQGYSVGKIADDLQDRMEKMNRSSALRTARTAITGAQNAGRQDSYIAAEKMGIKMKREWLATLDNRTRHAHAVLDGQRVGVNEPFKVDGYEIMFPGDPTAKAYLVYNCRCTLIAAVDGVDTSDAQRRARDPETGESVLVEDMTYAEWAGRKEKVQVQKAMAEKQEEIEPVKKQTETVTQAEWDVLEDYVSGEGMDVNNFLRQRNGMSVSDMTESERKRLSLIDSAMGKSELPKDQVLYRSVDASAVFDKDALKKIRWGEYSDEDLQGFVGKTITDKGFMSTTTDKEIAFGWGDFTGSKSPIVLQLDTPRGTHGVDLRRFDIEGEEQKEILLDRGLSYEITSIGTEKMRFEDEFGEYYETSIVVKAKVKKK